MSWRPSAAGNALEARAELLGAVRAFFQSRDSLEVEVPVLSEAPASDPWIDSFQVRDPGEANAGYLLSSPETYLKRLLAVHPRPLHTITKAFRASESGRLHAREFTMLEWYRPSTSPFSAMVREIQDLVTALTDWDAPEVVSYRACFEAATGENPHRISEQNLQQLTTPLVGAKAARTLDRDSALNLVFASVVEPSLSQHIVIDFPEIQASLSEVVEVDGDRVAKRAELYLDGIELANGYSELTDSVEQAKRFDEDAARRRYLERPTVPRDDQLLAALAHGLPQSYGVALGLDRLLMVISGIDDIHACLSFREPT